MMKIRYFLGIFLILMVVPNAWSSKSVMMGASVGYYWKPFNGTIPKDAVLGVNSSETTYIGRGPVWNGGLFIGELLAGVPSLTVTGPPTHQVHTIDQNIEVLCSEQKADAFVWVTRNTGESIHEDLPKLIQAGYEKSELRPLFVARSRVSVRHANVKSSYDLKLAKVTLNEPQRDAYDLFYYPDGNKEGESELFEVLTITVK